MRREWGGSWIAVALFLLGMAVMFHPMLHGGLGRSVGDSGDGLILLGTLEHWLRLLHGDPVGGPGGGWRTIGFFWPEHGTLGLTDSYFILAVPFCLFRLAGIGVFSAYNLTIALMATTGFWGFVALSRRWSAAAWPFAALGGFIFTFGSMSLWLLVHAQTYTMMLAPPVGLLLLACWRQKLSWPARLAFGVGAGLLYGVILLSAPETAWFLGFAGGLVSLSWLVLALPGWRCLKRILLPAAGLLIGLAIAFVPVVALYIPDLRLQHTRSYVNALYYMPEALDLIHVPPTNWAWQGIEFRLGMAGPLLPRAEDETALGYTPILLASVVLGALALGLGRWATGLRSPLDRVAQAAVLGALLCWALELDYAGTRPWKLIFDWVPGASIIRTPFRIQIAGMLFLCLALAHIGTRFSLAASAAIGRQAGIAHERLVRPAWVLLAIGIIFTLCVLEQFSSGAIMRDNGEVTAWLDKAAAPPFACRVFYLVPMHQPGFLPTWYEHQSDAILLSQKLGIPTVNGNSSWWPDDWHLDDPTAPDYPAHALAWIRRHGLQDQICGADPRANRWVPGLQALLSPASF